MISFIYYIIQLCTTHNSIYSLKRTLDYFNDLINKNKRYIAIFKNNIFISHRTYIIYIIIQICEIFQ